MTLKTQRGEVVAEDAGDLSSWLKALPAPLPLQETILLTCPQHDDDNAPGWFYVEADRSEGLARHRCLACARSAYVMDSEQRWTFPPTWTCGGCAQSIVELAAGLHVTEADTVSWLVLAARCVECGRVQGLTDLVLADLPRDEVVAGL